MAYRAITPNININTESGQLRTELLNTFTRLDGQLALAPFRLEFTLGPISNTSAANQILSSATISYNTLTKNGQSIIVAAAGTTSANANNKNIQLYLGNTLLFETGNQAFNDEEWTLEAELVRTSSTSQTTAIKFFATGTLTQKIEMALSSVELASNNDLTIRAQGADDDTQLYYAKYTFLP